MDVVLIKTVKVWADAWKRKIATPFRFPVDLKAYPKYMDYVQKPISLSEIRDNIGQFESVRLSYLVGDFNRIILLQQTMPISLSKDS